MGKVEKIVVLSVLFVIVLILVLSDPGDQTQAKELLVAGPAEAPSEAEGLRASRTFDRAGGVAGEAADPAPQDPPQTEEATAEPVGDGEGPAGLLVAVQRVEPVYILPDAIPGDWTLRSLTGLTDHTFDPTHKVYQAREGDSFEALAEQYYGDSSFARLLRRANEGQEAPEPGQKLLVPTHDDGVSSEAARPANTPEGTPTYVALDGESLWVIAKKNYGKGHLWPRIWEANQDRLRNPDFVPEGVMLLIPAAE